MREERWTLGKSRTLHFLRERVSLSAQKPLPSIILLIITTITTNITALHYLKSPEDYGGVDAGRPRRNRMEFPSKISIRRFNRPSNDAGSCWTVFFPPSLGHALV